jgi:two-component system, OmpR family, sensor histidine kinase KdpD
MSAKTADFNLLGSINGRQLGYPAVLEAVSTRSRTPFAFSGWSVRRFLQTSMVAQAVVGLFAILLVTEVFRHTPSINSTTVGFAYILVILAASTSLELRASIAMCIAATLAYDYYFIPPANTFNIDNPQDWVALFAFLVTALVGSQLAARARRRAEESTQRRLEVERLYGLSRRLLSAGDPIGLLGAIPNHIVESFAFESAALYLSATQEIFCSLGLSQAEIQRLRAAAARGRLQIAEDRRFSLAPIRLGDSVVGCVALGGPTPSREVLDAVVALVAVAIDRARAIELVAKIEAKRESERLKSVLLDAITHDFRTPLTSIKISATGLLEDLEFDREQRKELLTIIDEECDRINQLVGEASEMARLESGEMKLDLALHSVEELISAAVADCKEVARNREICLDLKCQDQSLVVDLSLAKKVLVHLITNAHLYSSPGEPITIATDEREGFQFISVADRGPGIDETEVNRIFEKFYRGKKQRYHVQGTGMGLPIAKAIVETHGGTIEVVSGAGNGSVFTFSLPIER